MRIDAFLASVSAFCSATCKLLCISCLTETRVAVFATLKMPKVLIVSRIRVARPVGSCQTALCLMKLQYFRTIIFYPDLSRYKNFSIFASSKQPQTSMGKTDDSGFVNGLRTGDAEAWRHLFVRYYAVYLRFVTKIVGDANSAKDIVQEVFMKL